MHQGPPIILTHPCNKDVESGQAVELRVTADGSKPLKYEWFKNAKLLEGEMTAVLTLHNAKPGETIGTYSCRVSNRHGSAISSFATVHVIGMSLMQQTVGMKTNNCCNIAQLRLKLFMIYHQNCL